MDFAAPGLHLHRDRHDLFAFSTPCHFRDDPFYVITSRISGFVNEFKDKKASSFKDKWSRQNVVKITKAYWLPHKTALVLGLSKREDAIKLCQHRVWLSGEDSDVR